MIVDGETNQPVGVTSRKEVRKNNLWHRASYVFIQNSENQFIVQVRSKQKEYCPGGIDLAAGGLMGPNETDEQNASRELKEELGIQNNFLESDCLTRFAYQDAKCKVWCNVFYVKLDNMGQALNIQREEIERVYYWNKTEMVYNIDDEDGPNITPDTKEAFR